MNAFSFFALAASCDNYHQLRRKIIWFLICMCLPLLTCTASTPSRLDPDGFIRKWQLLGPIPVAKSTLPDEAAPRRAFDTDFLAPVGGEANFAFAAETKIKIGDKDFSWQLVDSPTDVIDLVKSVGAKNYTVTYAWLDFETPAAKGLLGVGSDDGVKIWLNGKLVHENRIERVARTDDDAVQVEFRPGINHVLLKIQNITGASGFAFRLMGPDGQAASLIQEVRLNDLTAVERLLAAGVDVKSHTAVGLTAVQAAKLAGLPKIIELLARSGADLAEPIPSREKLTDDLLRRTFKNEEPGVAVLIAKDGKILFEKGYGLANLENQIPVTPNTVFRIGSVTKQFTSASILKLAESGKLSVQDKLTKFIPDYPRGDEVTIRHLLTHTSGIHNYTEKPGFFEQAVVGTTAEEWIRSFKNDPFDFSPGEKWSYSNSGFYLLGWIVEHTSGQSYSDYLRQNFFEPLAMTQTGVHEPTAIIPHEATGYSADARGWHKALNWDMSKAGGAGSIYSTVGDLFRWNEAVFSGRVLSVDNQKAAFTPVKTTENAADANEDGGYGYGWVIAKYRGTKEISHGGGLHGFLSFLLRLPAENLTVVVLENSSTPPPNGDPAGLAHKIAELYLGDRLPPRELSATKEVTLSSTAIDAVLGRYDYRQAILTVSRDGTRVFAQLGGQPRFEIFPTSETDFFWKVVEARVTFVKDERGVTVKAIHHQNGSTLIAPKLVDTAVATIDPSIFDHYIGRYKAGAGAVLLTVSREENRFYIQLAGQPKFEVFPKSETEFFLKEVNAQLTFVKDGNGRASKVINHQAGQTFEFLRSD